MNAAPPAVLPSETFASFDELPPARNRIKALAYKLGLLTLYHRWVNRSRLTVVMFHRVLPEDSKSWANADPDYTITTAAFADCLAFFIKHYDVVTLDQVLASRCGAPLPARPLLITFDDGWTDTLTHAAPILRQWGLPAVCFVIGDVLEENGNNWWQNDFTLAWRKNTAISAGIATAWNELRPDLSDPSVHPPFQPANSYLAALAMLQDLPPPGRAALARTWDEPPNEPVADDQDRQMLSPADVIKLREAGWAIGAHGASHMPLTLSRDPRGELAHAYKRLQPLASESSRGGALSMSFPHGRYSPEIVAAARACGYSMMFTSDQHLMHLRRGRLVDDLCGRIEVATRDFSRGGAFMPVLLALHLFRRPVSPIPRCNL